MMLIGVLVSSSLLSTGIQSFKCFIDQAIDKRSILNVIGQKKR